MPEIPTDREKCGLHGPVCLVVTRRIAKSGESTHEQAFDRDGRVVAVRQRGTDGSQSNIEYRYDDDGRRYDATGRKVGLHIRTVRNSDGSRVETDDVSRVDAWAIEGMNGAGFGTRGASIAETTFDSLGNPLGAVLRNDRGDEFLRVVCTCDAEGRIAAAVQYGGAALPPPRGASEWAVPDAPAGERELGRAFSEPGFEQWRIAFRYDSAGRVVERTESVAGQEFGHTVYTYNERGDLRTSRSGSQDEPQVYEFEYDYDERDNWIHKTAQYFVGSSVTGSDEYHRTISYYE